MSDTDNRAAEIQSDVGAQRLARVYATALLDAAAKQGADPAGLLEELDSLLDDVVRQDAQLAALFAGAAVGRHIRRVALEKAFGGRASPVFFHFLLVLNEHERLMLLPPIRAAAHDLENERHRRKPVQVWSAVPLTDAEKGRLADGVRQRFQFEPILKTHVDPALLGGLKLRIGDMQIDDTVRTRLDNIRSQIIARSSYEIQSRRDRFRTQ
jgi:F-type H+-transporting ATPase subunit delta